MEQSDFFKPSNPQIETSKPNKYGSIYHHDDPHNQKGKKDDNGKIRMDLIPPEAIFAFAEVLTFGAKKYTDRNWEKGIELDRLFAATQRHLWAMWKGELIDPESNLPHSYHALTNIAMYITLNERNKDG